MGAEQTIEGVGIGVSLFDGASTLETLRAIRSEMVAIASLGSGGSGGANNPIYGPSQNALSQLEANYRAQERVEQDHNIRMARIRAEGNRPIADTEVQNLAQKQLRSAELKSQVAARARQIEQETADKQAALEQRIADEAIQRRARIEAYKQVPGFGTGPQGQQLTQQRALFQQYRNDPARDTLTNQFRQQLAEETVAQREYLQARRKLRAEFEAEQQREFEKIRSNIQGHLANPPPLAVNPLEQALGQGREGSYVDPFVTRKIQRRAINARSRNETLGKGNFTADDFTTDSKGRLVLKGNGGTPPPDEPSEEGAGPQGRGPRGATDIIGRAVGYFALYQVLRTVVSGTKELITTSLEAAKALTEQGNALKYATEAAGGNLEANRALAEGIRRFGFDRIKAQEVVATAARISYRHPEDVAGLTQLATDISASRGGGLEKAPGILQDIVEGRDRTYREIFNTTPEDIYKQAGKKAVESRSAQDFRGIGNKDYDTEAQKITKYVSALTEEEKEQLRLNYALSQSGRFSGDAAERATTLAGKMDLVGASFSNAAANIGLFITSIRPVKSALDLLSGPQALDFLRPPTLQQSGPQNTITEDDIKTFGRESAKGPQAQVSNLFSKIFAVALPLVPGTGFVKSPNELEAGFKEGNYNPLIARGTGREKQIDDEFAQALAEAQAYRAKVKREADIAAKGEFEKRYRYIGPDRNRPLNETLSGQDLVNRGDAIGNGRGGFTNYIEDYVPVKKPPTDILAPPVGYRQEAQKREDERKLKEDEERAKDFQDKQRALTKLRDFKQGSFRVIDETGSRIAGPDNAYVKVLADQYTAAERMHQQWGFLGKDIEDYENKLEQAALNRTINKLEFGSYQAGTNIQGQTAREQAQRNAPGVLGLSRIDDDQLNIQNAVLNKAISLAQLQRQYQESLGRTINPITNARNRVNQIGIGLGFGLGEVQGPTSFNGIQFAGGQRAGFSAGEQQSTFIGPDGKRVALTLDSGRRNDYAAYDQSRIAFASQSPEVRKRVQQSAADATIDALKDLTPAQLRQSGLGNIYRGALNVKAQGLNEQVDDAIKKAQYGAEEDARLKSQLAQDDEFRRRQLAQGRKPDDVQTEADRLLLVRTEGINPKDLTFDQYKGRQDALKRQAQTEFGKEKEAKEAVQLGIDLQAGMLEAINNLRTSIINGDIGITLTVNNDTDAKVDTNALKAASPDPATTRASIVPSNDKLGANALRRYERFGKRSE